MRGSFCLEETESDCTAVEADLATCTSDLESANSQLGDCNSALAEAQAQIPVSKTVYTTVDVSADCETPTTWYFGTSTNTIDQSVCVHNGEYVIVEDGVTYPTCVQYNEDNNAVCDTSRFVCGGNNEVQGFAGQARGAITAALERADYKHRDCPTIVDECTPLGTYWTDFLIDATVFNAAQVAQVCASKAGMLRIVAKDHYIDTCVGFNDRARTVCPNDRDYICSGNDGGNLVYGWPGQIVASAGVAFANEAGGYRHPQCGGLLP